MTTARRRPSSLIFNCGVTASTLRPLWAVALRRHWRAKPSQRRGGTSCVCVHGCICVCKLAFLCVCLWFWTHMYACVYQCVCTDMYVYRHVHMCMLVWTCGVSACACLGVCARWCLCKCVSYRQPPLDGMPVLLLGARWWQRWGPSRLCGEGSAGCRKKIQRPHGWGL